MVSYRNIKIFTVNVQKNTFCYSNKPCKMCIIKYIRQLSSISVSYKETDIKTPADNKLKN